jgi:hypothetical protein
MSQGLAGVGARGPGGIQARLRLVGQLDGHHHAREYHLIVDEQHRGDRSGMIVLFRPFRDVYGTAMGRPRGFEVEDVVRAAGFDAALTVYRGQILDGVPAPWQPIVSRQVFDAVSTLLTDPSRRQGPGAAPRWLGTGPASWPIFIGSSSNDCALLQVQRR